MTTRYRSLAISFSYFFVLLLSARADQYDLVSRLTGNPSFPFHASPADWRDVNMYQLFTDRFADGNTTNNLARYSTTGTPWYNVSGSNAETNRHFFQGGDWAGIKQKIGYLKNMGVNCIWISGVQMNEQGTDKRFTPYHAYHPANFYRAEPMFGTFAELKDLVDSAHSNGIYVVLDVVVNHMADLLKYTDCNCNYEGYCENNCGSLGWWDNGIQFGAPFNNPAFFHNNGTIGDNDWDTYPKYVKGSFLGTEDLKTEDTNVQSELRWAFKNLIDATDCDGFRVDAIKHMEYDFIKQWADDMRKYAATRNKNNFLLFGEYFSYDDNTQASYCKDVGYSFNSTLWFPMQLTMKNVFANEQGTDQLVSKMNAMSLYGEATDKLVAFMDNHDVDRIALECGSQWEAKLRPALTFLYTALPVPCLYYGTEQGFNQGDHRNGSPKLGLADWQRESMMNYGFQPGNASGDNFVQTSPLYLHIKKLNELRAQYPSLRRGAITQRWSESVKGLFAIGRVDGSEEALVAINTDWGTKSMNPSVNKPNGTVFQNVLNAAETVTVSGGKLSFSVDGKGSKIFIAGQGSSLAETSCNGTTLTITYKPNGGPLAAPVGNIHVAYSHDGGLGATNSVMTHVGSDWTYGYALAGTTSSVTFWFYDEAGIPTTDTHSNQNWTVDVRFCGSVSADLAWIGNANNYPTNGAWDAGEDLWVNVESWPKDAVASAEVVFSNSVSGTWQAVPMSFNGTNGNNDAWHRNLGTFPAGTKVRYAVHVIGRNTNLWENNTGADYSVTANAGPTTVTNVGGTYHWPENGLIEPQAEVWVNISSAPAGAGKTGEVVYSSDTGVTWLAKGLSHNGIAGGRDQWHANLGGFPALATIRYAVKVTDNNNVDRWDNNNFSNFLAIVNDTSSSIHWFGNAIQGGVGRPEAGIDFLSTSKTVRVHMHELCSNAIYTLKVSHDLRTWSAVTSVNADALSEVLDFVAGDPTSSNGLAIYRVELDWAPGPSVYDGDEAVISIETWPIGGATGANLVHSEDDGTNWHTTAMHKTGTRGANDIWSVSLGTFPMGTWIQYAVEVLDDQSHSQWDNNGGQDHKFKILDPNVTDFLAPTTSYSPQNTVTTNPTLDVILSASDDQDPAPVIYFTTNGAAPTVASPVYVAPIHVTDQGSGIDRTIKFFARDVSGNTSGVTTIDVKVGETPTFGGNKPYSVNPTLGKAVANGAITIDGSASDWTTNMLIALDMANDDPRSLGSNWTLHEAPIDMTHLWAAWDDTYLYVAWQYVDITDVRDPSNAGSAGGGKISNNDGILQWMAIDTKAGGAPKDVWSKNNGSNYWNGVDLPDYQMYMAGSLWQSYISRASNGVFALDDGGINYMKTTNAGITLAKGNVFGAPTMWGVNDCDDRFNVGAPDHNFVAEGHSTARDSFYETRIPLSFLQITRAQLESQGVGVMMGAGSMSCMDSLPNDATTTDTAGVEVWNSSKEWSDTDSFLTPFARIGVGQ